MQTIFSVHMEKNLYISVYTGCSAKMYPIFVLFISPVKIEIFQVCLFHIIENFVFHSNFFFPEYLLNYECTVRSWMNRGKLCLYQGIMEMTLLLFFFYFQFSKQGNPIPTIKQKMNSNKHKLSFNLNQPLVSFNMTFAHAEVMYPTYSHILILLYPTYSHMRMWDTILFFGWRTKFSIIWNKQTWNISILTGDINNTKIWYIFAEHPVYA